MTNDAGFQDRYAHALHVHLRMRDEATLAVGHELGRLALQTQLSMLEIVEGHFRLLEDVSPLSEDDHSTALQFLLQTLATFDVATRGFVDGTRRYELQRARADDLADRDAFRTALVNSLQEGFFVANDEGTVIEVNEAFGAITGYHQDGLPYAWPHPWVADQPTAAERLAQLIETGSATYETQIRCGDGHQAWVAVSINAVTAAATDRQTFVGTVRDVTDARASAARSSAVMRLATATGKANSVTEVLAMLLQECRSAIDLRRVVAVTWPTSEGEPTIQMAGEPFVSSWRDLDPGLRAILEDAREAPALTVQPARPPGGSGMVRGIVVALSDSAGVTVWLEHEGPREFSADDRLLLTALVGHLSVAIQHVKQFEYSREASLTLQRAMLPPTRPLRGFAVRYEPAVRPLEIGGDWYDVLSLGEHRIGIIVGDCVGRGLAAAAVMGQLRSSARALFLTGAEPGRLLEELDSVAALIPDAYCATAFAAILDTSTGVLQYSSAGHMPAVLASPDSPAVMLTDAESVPLVVRGGTTRPQAQRTLAPEATLILFTDGLVERRDSSIDAGLEQVAEVLNDTLGLTAESVADEVLREMAPAEGYDDDVAIVVYRDLHAPLRFELPAEAERLSEVRQRLWSWLRAVAIPDELASDIVLVVNEAATNCVEHAYVDSVAGIMGVDARIVDGAVQVHVVDDGKWKTPSGDTRLRGRGLPMMDAVSESVLVQRAPTGTTVEMRFPLPGESG
ncbi:SpoIIE family protein phosphatase [Mycobacterium sp. URHB0044]|uniref:SpoIIE family protein phosphatase n=1 Tax=Mycobacterium sp. URHB0044 TaxID=1380386 RepID=UPI00048C72C6|nr:SpoIIE family protein phosphatase [Mycobacterium sp. URHB0044]